ncbi:hypothetical protein RUND412_001976 [Rhizina undulata]
MALAMKNTLSQQIFDLEMLVSSSLLDGQKKELRQKWIRELASCKFAIRSADETSPKSNDQLEDVHNRLTRLRKTVAQKAKPVPEPVPEPVREPVADPAPEEKKGVFKWFKTIAKRMSRDQMKPMKFEKKDLGRNTLESPIEILSVPEIIITAPSDDEDETGSNLDSLLGLYATYSETKDPMVDERENWERTK